MLFLDFKKSTQWENQLHHSTVNPNHFPSVKCQGKSSFHSRKSRITIFEPQLNRFNRLFFSRNVIKTSESGKMAKIFSSFDLGSVQISFVGMMGEFAVWAIEDMLTGEIQYIVDDRKGSLRYLFLA